MKKIKILIFSICCLILVAGCGVERPEQADNEVLRTGIVNFLDYDKFAFDLGFSGEIEASEDSTSGVVFDLNAAGDFDNSDPALRLGAIDFDGSIQYDGEEGDVSFDVRASRERIYFKIDEIAKNSFINAESLKSYLGQWWYFNLPASSFASLLAEGNNEDKIDEEFLAKFNLFKNTQFKGTQSLNDVEMYRYGVELDSEELARFMVENAERNRTPLLDVEKKDLKRSLESVQFNGEMWVSVEDMTLYKMAGNLTVLDAQGEPSMRVDVDMEFSDLGEDIEIEIPENATDLEGVL